ncbi:MAG: hypothetical protein FJX76_06610 [Armatimonadetes bacterium]|nr:hypothetical protein [Armatimonadota bacterium]
MAVMRALWVAVVLVLLGGAASWAEEPPRKYAVVVGVNTYENGEVTPLRYAVRDARALGAALRAVGFDKVFEMTSDDPRARVIRRAPTCSFDWTGSASGRGRRIPSCFTSADTAWKWASRCSSSPRNPIRAASSPSRPARAPATPSPKCSTR